MIKEVTFGNNWINWRVIVKLTDLTNPEILVEGEGIPQNYLYSCRVHLLIGANCFQLGRAFDIGFKKKIQWTCKKKSVDYTLQVKKFSYLNYNL